MKKITIIIKPSKLDVVLEELQKIKGLLGLSIVQSLGFDHLTNIKEIDLLELECHSKVEIIAHDNLVSIIHDTIVKTVYSGFAGDGSIIVSNIDSMFNIASKEYI